MLFRSGGTSRHLPNDGGSTARYLQGLSVVSALGRLLPCHALAIALLLGVAQSAFGADTALDLPQEPIPAAAPEVAPDVPPDWAFQVTPYMWAAGMDGHISPFRRGPTIAVEKSFSDVLDDLDFGGFIHLWGRYDRFVLLGDIMYVHTSDSHEAGPLPSFTIPGVGVIPAGGNIDASVDTKQFTATLMGGYRVIETPQFSLDALAGGRYWHISNDVKISGSLAGLSGSVSYKESFGWFDPLIGLRAFVPVTEKLSLQGQADIGGFGAGSDLTWSALATVNYVFTDSFSASAGYKVLDVDYSNDGHVFDTRLSGPVLGLTYRF